MTKLPYRIILGSQSPRRKELLSSLGLEFDIRVLPNLEENYPESLCAEFVPKYLAIQKALAYKGSLAENELLITSDTVVISNQGEVLGKPNSREEACAMINLLQGEEHSVITGVAFMLSSGRGCAVSDVTKVTLAPMTEDEINYYVETYKPYDKAGAYGIQEWIGYANIPRIKGSFYNVMGLPTHLVYEVLSKWLHKEKELVSLSLDFDCVEE